MSLKKSLSSLIHTFVSYVKEHFHLASYVYILLFTSVCIFLNYCFDFYTLVMRSTFYSNDSLWAYPLFYTFIYFAAAIPVLFFQKDYKTLRDYRFYLKSLVFIAIYGVSVGYFQYRKWDFPSLLSIEKSFLIRIISQLKSVVLIGVPLVLMKLFVDKKKVSGLYGLSRNTEHLNAYVFLLLLLLPFLVVTSFTPDFVEAYPRFRPWFYNDIFGLPTWVSTLIFEASYSMDFVMTELFFRGALVIGMTAILGPKAVLPMVAFYAAIHFGKPLLETVSSIFGGYILGVLAYQTKHIWGGVIVHIGIALIMEIMGFIQYYLITPNP